MKVYVTDPHAARYFTSMVNAKLTLEITVKGWAQTARSSSPPAFNSGGRRKKPGDGR